MLNINLGGMKGFNKFAPEVQAKWKILDADPKADYVYNMNSHEVFPFKNNEVDNYYASMILEHIYPSNLSYVFNEINRTLKVGGIIRIVVPDIKKGIKEYMNNNLVWLSSSKQPTADSCYPPTCLGMLIGWFYTESKEKYGTERHGHNMVYDYETMKYYLHNSGFKNIQQKSFNNCNEVFNGKDFPRYADFGLYVEAVK